MKLYVGLALVALTMLSCSKVHRSILLDYEDKPVTTEWWRFNDKVKFEYKEVDNQTPIKASKTFLNVHWDYSSSEGAYTWFTDLKIDSLRNPKMVGFRKAMGNTIWLSFWCRVNSKDSLYVHPMVLTHNHKGKWGSTQMTLITSDVWKFYKYDLSSLKYEKWGKEGDEMPNFSTTDVRCFELGLRKGSTASDGVIDADFDNLMISNYEPNGDEYF